MDKLQNSIKEQTDVNLYQSWCSVSSWWKRGWIRNSSWYNVVQHWGRIGFNFIVEKQWMCFCVTSCSSNCRETNPVGSQFDGYWDWYSKWISILKVKELRNWMSVAFFWQSYPFCTSRYCCSSTVANSLCRIHCNVQLCVAGSTNWYVLKNVCIEIPYLTYVCRDVLFEFHLKFWNIAIIHYWYSSSTIR